MAKRNVLYLIINTNADLNKIFSSFLSDLLLYQFSLSPLSNVPCQVSSTIIKHLKCGLWCIHSIWNQQKETHYILLFLLKRIFLGFLVESKFNLISHCFQHFLVLFISCFISAKDIDILVTTENKTSSTRQYSTYTIYTYIYIYTIYILYILYILYIYIYIRILYHYTISATPMWLPLQNFDYLIKIKRGDWRRQ